jgi:hypothetical protein
MAFGVVRKRPRTNDRSFLVECAVVTPDIAKVNPDRHLNPGLPAWDFRDEVLRWLLHGQESLRLEGPVHPIYRYHGSGAAPPT